MSVYLFTRFEPLFNKARCTEIRLAGKDLDKTIHEVADTTILRGKAHPAVVVIRSHNKPKRQ